MRSLGLILGLGLAVLAHAGEGAERSGQSAAEQAGALPTAAAVAAADPDPSAIARWPAGGHIVYHVFMGDLGFPVGEARHEWTHDDRRYSMTATVRTTGLAAAIRELEYVQRSEGAVGPQGLRPERFSVDQTGKKPESAVFDWSAGRVTIRRGKRERIADIVRGDQDVLSLWHQIGLMGAKGVPRELTVVSGKAATPSTVQLVGSERLSLPIGDVDALRLRAQARDGKLTIDIWLSRGHGMLPVRIRAVDDKGDVLDQHATEVRIQPPAKTAEGRAVRPG